MPSSLTHVRLPLLHRPGDKHAPTSPNATHTRLTIPSGSHVRIRPTNGGPQRHHITSSPLTFLKADRYHRNFYYFTQGAWLIKVHTRLVTHTPLSQLFHPLSP